MTDPVFALLYLQATRPERLRAAFSDTLAILGPTATLTLIKAIRKSCNESKRSRRMQYNFSTITLVQMGINGPAATAIIKEAWNPGSLTDQLLFTALSSRHATHEDHSTH